MAALARNAFQCHQIRKFHRPFDGWPVVMRSYNERNYSVRIEIDVAI
jgi:hypothetical protein